jgi:hypothetical protein
LNFVQQVNKGVQQYSTNQWILDRAWHAIRTLLHLSHGRFKVSYIHDASMRRRGNGPNTDIMWNKKNGLKKRFSFLYLLANMLVRCNGTYNLLCIITLMTYVMLGVCCSLFLYMVYAGLTRMSTGGLEFMCFNSFRDRTWHMREHPIVWTWDIR